MVTSNCNYDECNIRLTDFTAPLGFCVTHLSEKHPLMADAYHLLSDYGVELPSMRKRHTEIVSSPDGREWLSRSRVETAEHFYGPLTGPQKYVLAVFNDVDQDIWNSLMVNVSGESFGYTYRLAALHKYNKAISDVVLGMLDCRRSEVERVIENSFDMFDMSNKDTSAI